MTACMHGGCRVKVCAIGLTERSRR
jgi:hypothetical protein